MSGERWEYRVVQQPLGDGGRELEDALNALGRDGWELVGLHLDAPAGALAVLKRPVTDEDPGRPLGFQR